MITAKQFRAMNNRGTRRNKYGVSAKADRTWGGKVYASKAERIYAEMYRAGIASEQVRVPLGPSGIEMVVDFQHKDGLCVDVKGKETDVFRLKCRLWMAHGPGPLRLVKLVRGEFKTLETIVPGQPRQKRARKPRSKA